MLIGTTTITSSVQFHVWSQERIVCTKTLSLPNEDRDVISDRLSAQKNMRRKKKEKKEEKGKQEEEVVVPYQTITI